VETERIILQHLGSSGAVEAVSSEETPEVSSLGGSGYSVSVSSEETPAVSSLEVSGYSVRTTKDLSELPLQPLLCSPCVPLVMAFV
jgi:hypothetical protein